jgi:kynurenine formamidase
MSTSNKIFDLSHSLEPNITVCDGHPSYECRPISSIGPESKSNVSALSFGTHTGTHIDAPFHFFPTGAKISALDLSKLIAPALIVDVHEKQAHEKITLSDLPADEQLKPIVIFYTGWSRYWCKPEYPTHPSLTAEVAQHLIDSGVRVVGIDALSPDDLPDDGSEVFDVHNIILGNDGIIAENLTDLQAVVGVPDLVVSLLPLKIYEGDGAPVRAVGWSASGVGCMLDFLWMLADFLFSVHSESLINVGTVVPQVTC